MSKRMPKRLLKWMQQRSRKRFGFLEVLIGGIFLVVIASFWIYMSLPDVRMLKTQFPVVQYRGPVLPPLVSFQKTRPHTWVNLNEISKQAVGAIVVSEDWAYYQHNGYDMNQIKEAFREDWEEKKFARGASTITQQVARNVFLSKEKNLWRKAKEFYLAIKLDEVVGKKRTLETYFNIAEWGPGVFGIRAAAHYYFLKDPVQLTAKEGAFLAMLLPSPVKYGQSFRKRRLTDYAEDTVESILSKMTQAHYITEDERILQTNTPLPFEIIPNPGDSPLPRPSEESDGQNSSI